MVVFVVPLSHFAGSFLVQSERSAVNSAYVALCRVHLVFCVRRLELQRTVDAFDDSSVVKSYHFYAACVSSGVSELVKFLNRRIFKTNDLHRTTTRYHHDRSEGVRAVEGRAEVVAPVRGVSVGQADPCSGAVVDVLAFGIGHVSNRAFLILPPHIECHVHVAVVFGVCVDKSGFLHRFDKLHRLRHSLTGEDFAQHVLSCVETADGVGSVLRCVVCEDYGVHVALQKFVKVAEALDMKSRLLRTFFGLSEKRLVFVTYRGQLSVGMVQEILNHGVSSRTAEHADFQLSVHF